MSEETNSNTIIIIEPIEYPEVKQEFDDYECTSTMSMENDKICLQQFLKSEVTIDEEMKQEKFDGQDAALNTSFNEKPYIFDDNISNSSTTSESFENVSEKCSTRDNLKPYIYEICNKTFLRQQSLKFDQVLHTAEQPYECEVCKKMFVKKLSLTKHQKECPYKCKICSKTFKKKDYLEKHNIIHTGEHPYSCEICNKTFARKDALKRHENIHNGECYDCNICRKTFTNKESYRKHKRRKHERVHTGELPYSCGICNKTFETKNTLGQHVTEVHAGIQPIRKRSTNMLNLPETNQP